jgi:hypothetical protein
MKKQFFLLLLAITYSVAALATSSQVKDTTVHFNNKIIEIRDSVDQVNVKVLKTEIKDTTAYKTVFEGLYSDNQSYERWSVVEELGIQIPFVNHIGKKKSPKHRYDMTSHVGGFGWGFITMTDGKALNNVNGVNLDLNRSYEFNYGLMEHITPIFFNYVGLSSGLGFSWRNYNLANKTYFKEENDLVGIATGAATSRYKYSRLSNWYLTVPLMLELQMFKSSKYKPYLAAGVIGDVRLVTTSKTKYVNSTGSTIHTKQSGMNVLPISLDYVAQAGIGKVSIYAKYSPLDIFEADKGPAVQHASIGFVIGM